jgi:hypothetical protein
MSPDPIAGEGANPQTLNRYTYSINDPINGTDPTGLFCPTKKGLVSFCTNFNWYMTGIGAVGSSSFAIITGSTVVVRYTWHAERTTSTITYGDNLLSVDFADRGGYWTGEFLKITNWQNYSVELLDKLFTLYAQNQAATKNTKRALARDERIQERLDDTRPTCVGLFVKGAAKEVFSGGPPGSKEDTENQAKELVESGTQAAALTAARYSPAAGAALGFVARKAVPAMLVYDVTKAANGGFEEEFSTPCDPRLSRKGTNE